MQMIFRLVHKRSGLYFSDVKNGKPVWTTIKAEGCFFNGQDYNYARSLGIDADDIEWQEVKCHDTNH